MRRSYVAAMPLLAAAGIFLFPPQSLLAQPKVKAESVAVKADSAQPTDWIRQMRMLEQTLVDGYPYFFTESAFKVERNRKTVLRHLENLKSNIHDLPVSAGEKILGAEPLIRGSRERMEGQLVKAIKAFEEKDFATSQAAVQASINQCVACHTAQGRGKQSMRINDEMFRIYTPTLQKVTSLVAIRQFEGAQKAIEYAIQGKMKYKDSAEQLDQLIKTHLLVSLRGLQDDERALKMLTKLQSQSNRRIPADLKKKAAQWMSDLLQWRQFLGLKPAETVPTKSAQERLVWLNDKIAQARDDDEKAYVYLLLKSSVLHGVLINEMVPESFAMSYEDLANTYRRLRMPVLAELSSVYAKACAALTGTEAGRRCEKLAL